MKRITPRHLTPKSIAIISVCTLVLMVIVIFGWSWLSRNNYQHSLDQQQQDLQSRLNQANQTLTDNQDMDGHTLSTHLEALRHDIQQLATQLPAQPKIINISLLSADQQAQLDDLHSLYRTVDQQLTTSSQLANYQFQIAPFIDKLSNGQGNNAEQQTALAGTWKQTGQEISNVIVPQVSQNFSQKLLSTINDISQDLSDLSEFYKKVDQQAYLERKRQLTTKFETFHALAEDHLAILKNQDQQLHQSLTELRQAY